MVRPSVIPMARANGRGGMPRIFIQGQTRAYSRRSRTVAECSGRGIVRQGGQISFPPAAGFCPLDGAEPVTTRATFTPSLPSLLLFTLLLPGPTWLACSRRDRRLWVLRFLL